MFNKDYRHLEAEVNERGYAIIHLLPDDTLTELNKETELLLNAIDSNLLTDTFLSAGRIDSVDIRNASSLSLKRNIVPFIEKIFDTEETDIISGVHLFKSPGNSSTLNPHQDSSLVDEQKYNSYYIWVPFQDTGMQNGTLSIIPGSHKIPVYQRSLNIPWPLEKYGDLLWKFMVPLDIKAGDAVLFHSGLIHASAPNKTTAIRVAANFFIKPKEALYLHYFTDADSNFKKIELYNVTPEFYLSCDIMKRPPAKFPLIRTEQNSNTSFSKRALWDFCLEQRKNSTGKKLGLKYKIPFAPYLFNRIT